MTEPDRPQGPPPSLSRGERGVFGFFANALLAVGWLSVVLGGLCTLAVGFFSVVGIGDSGAGHVALEDWVPAFTMLGFGGVCVWGGRALKRRVQRATGERGPRAEDP